MKIEFCQDADLIKFKCNFCLKEVSGTIEDKIMGLCQTCQDRCDKHITKVTGEEDEM